MTIRANGQAVQELLLSCNSIEELRTLTPLPDDVERIIDEAVVRVGRDRLAVVSTMLDAGLIFPVTDPLSVLTVRGYKIADSGRANRTMIVDDLGERALPDHTPTDTPNYATWEPFSIDVRTLRASQRANLPIDTTLVEVATRNVNESIEDAAINGAGLTVNGNPTLGLVNAPDAGTQTFIDNEAWDATGHSGEDIVTDVLAMMGVAEAAKKYGPFGVFVPTPYGNKLRDDYKANSSLTIKQRLEDIDQISSVVTADLMPDDTVALMQLTSDVGDVMVGQQPTPIAWSSGSGMNFFWIILAFMVPRFKSDHNGNSGIVIGTPS